jgi:hypothetical protein
MTLFTVMSRVLSTGIIRRVLLRGAQLGECRWGLPTYLRNLASGGPREPQILVERPDLTEFRHLAVDLDSRKTRRCSLANSFNICPSARARSAEHRRAFNLHPRRTDGGKIFLT